MSATDVPAARRHPAIYDEERARVTLQHHGVADYADVEGSQGVADEVAVELDAAFDVVLRRPSRAGATAAS